MRRALPALCLMPLLAVAACDDQSNTAANAPSRPANVQPDPTLAQLDAESLRNRAAPARLQLSTSSLTLALVDNAPTETVIINHLGGQDVAIQNATVEPVTAPVRADLSGCTDLQANASCTLKITPLASAVPMSAIVTLTGQGFTDISLRLIGNAPMRATPPNPPAPPPPAPDYAAIARKRAYAEAVQAPIAYAPPAAVATAPSPHGLKPMESPFAQSRLSPRRDLTQVIERGRNVPVTVEHMFLTGRQGMLTMIASYPVYGNVGQAGINAKPILRQGARITATYESGGQGERAYLTVNQIVDIDGRTLILAPEPVYDQMGRVGMPVQRDNPIFAKAASRLIAEVLIPLVPLAAGNGTTQTYSTGFQTVQNQSAGQRFAEQFFQAFQPIGKEVVQEYFDTRPRQEGAAGTVLVLKPQTDWVLIDETDPAQVAAWQASLTKLSRQAGGTQ
jgi:hypothetical protein